MPLNEDNIRKARQLIAGLAAKPEFIATTTKALNGAGYSILKTLQESPMPPGIDPAREKMARTGLYLDTETTGLTDQDKIIQLAGIRFRYDGKGIVSIDRHAMVLFKDPGIPIPPLITSLTGIDDSVVAGKTITEADISNMTRDVSMVVAHHAAFDRPFVERDLPGDIFSNLPWYCSMSQIDWESRVEKGRSLELLMLKRGYTYKAHDAGADVLAGTVLLASPDPHDPNKQIFNEMHRNGSKDSLLLVALNSPFDSKDKLKGSGYSWNAEGKDTGEKAWQREINTDEESLSNERKLLQEVYSTTKLRVPAFRISALNRFSTRLGPRETFDLAPPPEKPQQQLFETPTPQANSVYSM